MLMKIIIISDEEAGYVSGSEGSEEELWRRRRLCTGIKGNHRRSGTR